MNPKRHAAALAALVFVLVSTCNPAAGQEQLRPFPAGYTDSPYVVPDGSALYFIHSTASTIDMLTANPSAQPVATPLPGQQGQNGPYWWNTDIYVTYKNPDGTWSPPQNLGPRINTDNLESGPWVSEDQTTLIFSRESVTDPSLSGTFIARRLSKNEPWGVPKRLPGALGMFGAQGFADLHMVPSGNLYFWSDQHAPFVGNGTLYWARKIGPNEWSTPQLLPGNFQSDLDETQPWVNDEETVIYFNRRQKDGNTQLWRAVRKNVSSPWGNPTLVPLSGFADPNGLMVWGEPSFTKDGTMFFVRFDTSIAGWDAELMSSVEGKGGSYMPPGN